MPIDSDLEHYIFEWAKDPEDGKFAYTLTPRKTKSRAKLDEDYLIYVSKHNNEPVLQLMTSWYKSSLPEETLSWTTIKSFHDFLTIKKYAYKEHNYGDIKEKNNDWKTIYGFFDYDHYTRDKTTGKLKFTTLPSGYCAECGVLLPVRNLTIDHQAPQEGGRSSAIIRVFRHFRSVDGQTLTDAGPKGRKGRFMWGPFAAGAGSTDRWERYSLNEKGILMYSAYVYAGFAKELGDMCMHHFSNLSPKCGYCNPKKGNR